MRYRPVACFGDCGGETFRCSPVLRRSGGEESGVRDILAHKGDIVETARRNALIMRGAVNDLSTAAALGHRVNLIVPVNSMAFGLAKGAAVMVDAMKRLDPELRNALTLELFNLPPNLTVDALGKITIPILPFFKKYIAEPGRGYWNFDLFTNLNFLGVTLDLGRRGRPVDEALMELMDFWSKATAARLGLFVKGIGDRILLETAERYQAAGMDGPLIGEETETLGLQTDA